MQRLSTGKPLFQKLGIKPGDTVAIIDAPENYGEILGELPADVLVMHRLQGRKLDLVQIFATDVSSARHNFLAASKVLKEKPNGAIWICWPKKRSSGIKTELGESEARKLGLECGFVDVKICAVDEIWSGLKFVRRNKPRAGAT